MILPWKHTLVKSYHACTEQIMCMTATLYPVFKSATVIGKYPCCAPSSFSKVDLFIVGILATNNTVMIYSKVEWKYLATFILRGVKRSWKSCKSLLDSFCGEDALLQNGESSLKMISTNLQAVLSSCIIKLRINYHH